LHPSVGNVCFVLIIGLTAYIAWKDLSQGLALVFAELFVGGKGYLISLNIASITVSLRIGLFVTIVLIWLLRHRGSGNPLRRIPASPRTWLIFLGALITWGVLLGIIKHHGLGPVYFDANAFLFFLLAPVLFSPSLDRAALIHKLILVLAGAST